MRIFTAASAALLAAAPLAAQDSVTTVPVRYAKGATATVIKGSVRGYATVNYTLVARRGQKLSVRMSTNNGASYFDVLAPGADETLSNGSIVGNRFDGSLPSAGSYTIQVYLMRSAARRGEAANYTLNIAVR